MKGYVIYYDWVTDNNQTFHYYHNVDDMEELIEFINEHRNTRYYITAIKERVEG